MRSIYSLCILIFVSVSLSVFGQEDDTVQVLPEMSVQVAISKVEIQRYRHENSFLDKKDIDELATNDVGELMSKLGGVNLKSYGGLGGLKTVSVRSLGSSHNNIVVDGFSKSNNQTGQVNVGRIQSDNVVGLVSTVGNRFNSMLPVSAQISGSSILIQTFENTFDRDSLMIRANVQYGSFNQRGGYLAGKMNRKKFFVSVFGKYRQADGEYDYSYLNGYQTVNGTRKNNDYLDYYYGLTAGFKHKKLRARVGYRSSFANQGLPGAVIYYNESADERLETKNQSLFTDAFIRFKKSSLKLYSNLDDRILNYQDPSYLNASNGVDDTYKNQSANGGLVYYHQIKQRSGIRIGLEHEVSGLISQDSLFAEPLRNRTYGLISGDANFDFGSFNLQMSSQYVIENNRNGTSGENVFRLNPYASFTSKYSRKLRIRHHAWYRNSLRMPSFNELYYNSIGNSSLIPETANQFNYTFEIVPIQKKMELHLRASLFFNKVDNKIVAIPTKNLFVWSMQNITKVNIYGGEFLFDFEKKSLNYSFDITGNYTFQRVIDVTPESFNYGDQLAYSPMHMANLDISCKYKNTGIRISNEFTSGRYSLNENIDVNNLPGFYLLNLAAFHTFDMEKNELKLQVNVKNLTNQRYAYIRSFIMPGINYLITLSYAFN